MQMFIAPVLVSLAAFVAVWLWGGVEALLLALALAALEVSLSFDNAIINAKVLGRMDAHWQERFLTWGMPVAVFGVRFVLPVLIISVAALVSPLTIAVLAVQDPSAYAQLLHSVDPAIHAFGGAFLLMVALSFFFDEEKKVHWFRTLEHRFMRWGSVPFLEAFLTFVLLALAAFISGEPLPIVVAGVIGIMLYLGMTYFTGRFTRSLGAAAGGAALFVYLNILDAAFSLDGVVGAFALTTQILVILVGLGIGAYFVRTFTVYLTRMRTIEEFIYLEHGAHWAIFSLALCLFAALFVHVPEAIPGGVGLLFAALSFFSSWLERKKVQI